MSIFWLLPVGLLLLGLISLVLAVKQMFRVNAVTTASRMTLFAVMSTAALSLFLVGSNLFTYQQLTQEDMVAEVKFRELQPKIYEATVTLEDGTTKLVTLLGDEWQFDVRMIKWDNKVTLAGLRPIYRPDRISGRYTDIEEERSNPKSSHGLSQNPGVDVWDLANKHKTWLPWVDAYYGSGTYLPMADGASFNILISDTGLVARPINQTAQDATEVW
ncbi:MAG: hypothetical protein AAF438_00835 [Pseudomonadota bacterium]